MIQTNVVLADISAAQSRSHKHYSVSDRTTTDIQPLIKFFALSTILISMLIWNSPTRAHEGNWPRSISLAASSPGGVYLAYGQGLARILSRTLQIEVTAEATQGTVQNVILLEKRNTMLAFVNLGPALKGWNGSDWAKGTRHNSMRVIFPMYDTVLQFTAAKRLAINSLAQFAGLRIGAGARAGTSSTYAAEIFNALGIAANIRHSGWDNIAAQIENGELDGAVSALGAPTPAIADLDAKRLIDFIEPTQDQIAVLRQKLPELSLSTLPIGTYRSMLKDYHSIGLYNFAVAHKELPDDLVYRIVKAVFENSEELVRAHPAAKETLASNIGRNTTLPLHPGAARYYREIGLSVPLVNIN
jgi:TRAP transporter TAXI family solute receptor